MSERQLRQVVQRLIANHPLGAPGDPLVYCRLPDGRVAVVDSRGHKLIFSADAAAHAAGEILSGPRPNAGKDQKGGKA